MDLKHCCHWWLYVARDIGMPAVAIGDRGVPMGMDDEDCGIGIVGGCSRMGVERSKASGEGHLSGLG